MGGSARDRIRKIEKIFTEFKEKWFVDDFSRDFDEFDDEF
ncbi:unnamed protein product [marine sediment metagenome]|uniref:Uncharacterized protein n=1 Tax=marine sediment metagenome TaxID=412755 RepID=X0ZLY3_9ZZZZ